jgi:hypothetical protein
MPHIYKERMTVEFDGDFVVFLIGMRINKLWKVHKWLPIFRAMPRMIKELEEHSELGFLGYTMSLSVIVQYWRSFEHLEAYARSRDHLHLPVWAAFNKRIRYADGDVGIWHETHLVQAGAYEAIYSGMPAFGLGKVGRLVPINGLRNSARGRLRPQAENELTAFEN